MGWSIEQFHARIAGVEVDYLARDPNGLLHIIEVKSAGSIERGIITGRQLNRLRRAASSLASWEAVEILILVALKGGAILPIPT